MNKLKLTILFLFMSLAASAQRLAVESLKLRPNDLSARNVKNQRHDLNGKPCALLKVMVLDNITKCSSGNIGDIVTEGPVKLIYITSATPSIELSFQYHYPLTINFADYGYKHLEGNSTYELNLVDAMQMMMGNGVQKIESATETKVEAKTETKPEVKTETNTEVKTESSPSSKDSHRNSIITPAEDIFKQSVEAEKAKDYDKAFKLCKKAAVAGNPRAQDNLAYYYQKGIGCKVDTKKALEWYEKAVVSGYGPAAFVLGYYYQEGNGITVKDAASAYNYYKIGADLGDRNAMSALADCYLKGRGTAYDIDKGLSMHKALAEDETDGWESFRIGSYYCYSADYYYYCSNRKQPDKSLLDPVEGMKWFRKSAQQNNHDAMEALGELYLYGKDVAMNKQEAVKWFLKAADLGNDQAMWNLGRCYEKGEGVEKNIDQAVYWYKKGAEKNRNDCKEALKRLGY
mgnify:CR=1 FL=1